MRGVDTDDDLRARIRTLEVELSQRTDEAAEKELQLQRYAADLRDTFMQERTRSEELRRSYMLTVRALSNAVEARDAYTGRHAERVAAFGLAIADVYGMRLSDQPEIEFGFLLHDVGKVAVPDAILFKPGPLTETQRSVMQEHPVTGSKIVREIEFLGAARDVIRSHHERWDGTGYPDGLAGDEIPLSARVFAVADTLDALTTRRPYREASTITEARAVIDAGSGSHFDPEVIVAFRALPDTTIEAIRERIGDE
jgi:putative nucleotidyltransferase with HDIG domain